MTQDELGLQKWRELMDFLETNSSCPAPTGHLVTLGLTGCLVIPEQLNMRTRWKHNKKLLNAGSMKEDRVALFNQLLEVGEKYRRVNQYE